ncbi:MAG: nucleoside monophosphate kinase, partial [Mycoplasmataceae bacterium]|nr:nucleoside monophosphate kinase [Mycoplasmataceae bacterium]
MVEKNIIFLGMPGSGKGTISSFLQEKEDIIQVSTGDIFREEIKNKTQLGLEVEKIVSLGAYVPDDITNEIVKNKITQLEK